MQRTEYAHSMQYSHNMLRYLKNIRKIPLNYSTNAAPFNMNLVYIILFVSEFYMFS